MSTTITPAPDVLGLSEYIGRHTGAMRTRTGQNHAAYLAEWGRWLAATHPHLTLDTLRTEHAQGWLSSLLDSGQQVTTARSKIAAVRALTAGLHRDGLLDRDPCAWLVMPRPPRRTARTWLGADDLLTLVARSDDAHPSVRAAVHLWALAGTRPAEPMHVDVRDLSRQDGRTMLYLVQRKGGDSDRIAVADPVADALWAAAGTRTAGPLLVDPRTGDRWNVPAARHQMRRLVRDLDLDPRLCPYSLRVSFIILALEAGVPERDVAAYVGHASTATLAHYDRMRATVSTERAAGPALTGWLASTACA